MNVGGPDYSDLPAVPVSTEYAQSIQDEVQRAFHEGAQTGTLTPSTTTRSGDRSPPSRPVTLTATIATVGDPAWPPLLAATPNHPEYPSAHSCITPATGIAVSRFLGTQQIDFTIPSVTGLGDRTFATPRQLTNDVANGRVWAGIHFRSAVEDGAGDHALLAGSELAGRELGDGGAQASAKQPWPDDAGPGEGYDPRQVELARRDQVPEGGHVLRAHVPDAAAVAHRMQEVDVRAGAPRRVGARDFLDGDALAAGHAHLRAGRAAHEDGAGSQQPRSNSLAGRFAIENLGQVFANKAILGVDGISLKHGCTVPSNAEAEIVRQMIKQTRGEIIVVADHRKWGVVSNFQIASIEEIDKLITDEKMDSSALESLADHKVECLIAGPVTIPA